MNELLPDSHFESVSLPQEKLLRGEKYWAPVVINRTAFLLPYMNIGTEDETRAIPHFNPDHSINEGLAYASSIAMRDMFVRVKPDLVVTPDATRFTWFIIEAFHRYHDMYFQRKNGLGNHTIEQVRLPVVTDRSALATSVLPETIREYRTISGQQRYLGVSEAGLEKVYHALELGQRVAVVDGIIASGGTVSAMRSALGLSPDDQRIYTLSVAKIGKAGLNYPPEFKTHEYASVVLPEIFGVLPPEELFSFAQIGDAPHPEVYYG
jgi:hypothetical protein